MNYSYHQNQYRPDEHGVFVFGSNINGYHGAGAAADAHHKYGARYGIGVGPTGQCYALPTKDARVATLQRTAIKVFVDNFLEYAAAHPETKFFVTRVGCGLAGYTDHEMAPLFRGAPTNCIFPKEWQGYVES